MQQGLASLFWFIVVVAAIPLALWLLKRSGYGGGASPASPHGSAPRTVATLALSPQQKVVTLEVGQGEHRTWLVLGVSPQGIRTLHTLPASDAADARVEPVSAGAVLPPSGFAALLSRLRSGSPHAQA